MSRDVRTVRVINSRLTLLLLRLWRETLCRSVCIDRLGKVWARRYRTTQLSGFCFRP